MIHSPDQRHRAARWEPRARRTNKTHLRLVVFFVVFLADFLAAFFAMVLNHLLSLFPKFTKRAKKSQSFFMVLFHFFTILRSIRRETRDERENIGIPSPDNPFVFRLSSLVFRLSSLPSSLSSVKLSGMCGFAGVVTWDDRYRVSPETLRRMSAAVAHRGPDGEGFYINHQQEVTPDRPQVALAFRRLAILDPDPRSNQPFTDGRRWLVFNGEIYNFRELRKELTSLQPDYEWRTTGDTEVLLRAYAVWGEKCVEHLNGMFAFVVWDNVEKSLFLARDRMGQKPLYIVYLDADGKPLSHLNYHFAIEQKPAAIGFASELGALDALAWWDRSLDQNHLALFLSLGYIVQGTIYRGARQLEPARRVMASREGIGVAPVYDTGEPRHYESSASETTRTLILRAVERQMVSDVPIGAFLSGGVDSSVITAAMRAVSSDVHTFSMGFDDPRYDESRHAEAIAKHLGTRHHRFVIRADAITDLPKLAAVFGEPFGDSSALPTHYLARETRSHVKVALSGDGGDELFGGYDRYRAIRIAEWFDRLPIFLRQPATLLKYFPGTHPKSKSARLKRLGVSFSQPSDRRYATFMRIFDANLLNQLILPGYRNMSYEPDSLVGLFGAINSIADAVHTALTIDRSTYLPGDLLTKVDRCSMLHGLEVRSPFMDHELVQFAAGLTTDQLLKGGPKRMLREAFADDLPAWVFKRKKMGFAVPIGEWFRGELRPMLRDTLFASDSFGRQHFNMKVVERLVDEHEQKKIDHSQRLYALLMLELWWNTMKT